MVLTSVLKDQQRILSYVVFFCLTPFPLHFPSAPLPSIGPPSIWPTVSPIPEVNVRRNRDLGSPPSANESKWGQLVMCSGWSNFWGAFVLQNLRGIYKLTNSKYIKGVGRSPEQVGFIGLLVNPLVATLWPTVVTPVCSSVSAQGRRCNVLRSSHVPWEGRENKNTLSEFLGEECRTILKVPEDSLIRFSFPALEFTFIFCHKELRAARRDKVLSWMQCWYQHYASKLL